MNEQIDTLKFFGETAVDLNFITRKDYEKLLKIQIETRPSLGEILIEMEKLSPSILTEEVDEFIKLSQKHRSTLPSLSTGNRSVFE